MERLAMPLLQRIEALQKEKGFVLAAIDGRCGSGKTSLAAWLEEQLCCEVLHMDHFYLPFEKRTKDWEQRPCANMDLDRFREELLEPLRAGKEAWYRPYHCRENLYGEERRIAPRGLCIAEGSYSQHPALSKYYDVTVFMTCSGQVQAKRLQSREKDNYQAFVKRWIPLEEQYFTQNRIRQKADVVLDTTGLWQIGG